MTSLRACVEEAAGELAATSETARLDAELLLAHVIGHSRTYLVAHALDPIGDRARGCFASLVARRRRGEPVAYLVGRRGFWTLDLRVTADTLVPRPETEHLVEAALADSGLGRTARVVDLGTGTGAIAIAVALERPGWRILATDRSAGALDVARANAAAASASNVEFARGEWWAACGARRFDLALSNPPYIAADDPCLGADGVRFEPREALVSGADGLDALREIVGRAPAHLESGGRLVVEHGNEQGAAVRALFARAGFEAIATRPDLAGLARLTEGRLARRG